MCESVVCGVTKRFAPPTRKLCSGTWKQTGRKWPIGLIMWSLNYVIVSWRVSGPWQERLNRLMSVSGLCGRTGLTDLNLNVVYFKATQNYSCSYTTKLWSRETHRDNICTTSAQLLFESERHRSFSLQQNKQIWYKEEQRYQKYFPWEHHEWLFINSIVSKSFILLLRTWSRWGHVVFFEHSTWMKAHTFEGIFRPKEKVVGTLNSLKSSSRWKIQIRLVSVETSIRAPRRLLIPLTEVETDENFL